jgi:hypothetical protein
MGNIERSEPDWQFSCKDGSERVRAASKFQSRIEKRSFGLRFAAVA